MQRNTPFRSEPEFQQAFITNERQGRIRNGKVASALVVVLMPAGAALDVFVYPGHVREFLQLRLLCSFLGLGLWALHYTSFASRHYRWLGIPIALLPAVFISWMIFITDGSASPYYAGLLLILLALNAIDHWTTIESVMTIAIVFVLYVLACLPWSYSTQSAIFYKSGILMLAGIIVVTGNYLYNQLHFREFVLRYELGQNRKKLEETNEKLVELDRMKSQFFANVSHELRTPLTLLMAPLQTLIHEHGPAFGAELQQLLSIMQSNGMRLLKLINDLLDLVRLEFGKMEVKHEPLDLEAFLRGLVNAVHKAAEDRGIKLVLTCHTVESVLTDSDKLERILLNLLFNALKFTPAGGRIEIYGAFHAGELLLRVTDTGAGISEGQLPFIFDRFWQADMSSQRKHGGLGIGLALVKELVEIQGGEVSVASELGKGTEFTVRLPCKPAEPEINTAAMPAAPAGDGASMAPAGPRHGDTWLRDLNRQAGLHPSVAPLRESLRPVESSIDVRQTRVLIADDEPDMLAYLKSQLSNSFQLIEAIDGEQAINKATQFLPDVIVCDMMMPEKNGLEVCAALRQRTSTRSIPILLLTARADEETKLSALSAGANDFITKPFSMTELRVRLKNLLDTYQLQQEIHRKNQMLEATLEQLKDAEVQLVHSEKLASLGRMSAGIIHEINNPLNFAKTGLYVLEKMVENLPAAEKPEFREVLSDMQEGITRISSIVSDLRTFTQPNVTQCEHTAVADAVNSALRLLSSEWQNKVRIATAVPDGQMLWANRNQLVQVLVNLLQNAIHAVAKKSFAEGGATISVAAVEQEGETVITVRDNGEGIAAEHLYKIFDPFFTTKDVGEGMGLGLSICYRIMKQHGGRIDVRSERGDYCEFALYFPHRPTSSMAA